MALGDGTAWDETTPSNSSNANDIDDYNRDVRKGVRIRMEYEHATFAGSSAGGKHKFITFQQQSTKPTVDSTQVAALYTKDDGASDQDLFFEREDAVEMQLTDGDFLNPEMADYWEFANQASAPSTAANKGAIYTKDAGGQPELFFREESDGDEVQITDGGVLKGGAIVQHVETEYLTYSSDANADITADDNIPQITEGTEVISRAITPTKSTNIIRVTATLWITHGSTSKYAIGAVFNTDFHATNAYAVGANRLVGNNNGISPVVIVREVLASELNGTTATTFTVRIGGDSGTVYINGNSTARLWGGTLVSRLEVEEIKV